jgi:hypothetical protein
VSDEPLPSLDGRWRGGCRSARDPGGKLCDLITIRDGGVGTPMMPATSAEVGIVLNPLSAGDPATAEQEEMIFAQDVVGTRS